MTALCTKFCIMCRDILKKDLVRRLADDSSDDEEVELKISTRKRPHPVTHHLLQVIC